jgi:hypothetical protein
MRFANAGWHALGTSVPGHPAEWPCRGIPALRHRVRRVCAAYGAAALVGGALTGYLSGISVPVLVAVVAVIRVVGLGLLVTVTRAWRPAG